MKTQTLTAIALAVCATIGAPRARASANELTADDFAAMENEIAEEVADQTQERHLVIVRSTRRFSEAVRVARQAARALGLELKLRGLTPHPETGLTESRRSCEGDAFEYPCYIARGRDDDGAYVSVEHSRGYGLVDAPDPNLYLVVVASGEPRDGTITTTLARARKAFPDAYVKSVPIYFGCLH